MKSIVEIREVLNSKHVIFPLVVKDIVEYISTSPNKEIIVNNIINKAKSHKGFTTTDLFKYFCDETLYIVEDTKMCETLRAQQVMLKVIWTHSNFLSVIIKQARNNFALFPVPKGATKEDASKPIVLTEEEQKKQRQKEQAQLMREAKAKKARERKLKAEAEKRTQFLAEQAKVQEAAKQKALQEQLELLRNLKI